jgi:hypothetical protein
MEIIHCNPNVPCTVLFTNCQTENCGLFGWVRDVFGF